MYQSKVRNPVGPLDGHLSDAVDGAIWGLFVAVGEFWELGDNPASYRQRFQTFLKNRIALNPLYVNFYTAAARILAERIGRDGADAAYRTLFTEKDRRVPMPAPETELDFVQTYVVNEMIALRLALGGFKAFSAINYRGYIAGANVEGQAPPYRIPRTGDGH